MAYQVVEDNFYTQQSIGPLGIPLPSNNYGIRYNPVTGEYQLRQFGLAGVALAGYDTVGGATLYQDGSWTSDAIQDSLLFKNNDINKPTQLAKSLSIEIRQKTQQAHVAIGGNAGGHKLHPTAQKSQHNAEAGVNNIFPGQSPPIDPNTPLIGNLLNPPGQDSSTPSTETPAANNSSTPKQFYGTNVFKDGPLKYPEDLLELQQDFLKIEQYDLSAANAAEVFSDPKTALSGGLKPLGGRIKQHRGTLYLPIPNNAADSNAVAWGSDQMNNLMAGLVAKASQSEKVINSTTGIAAASEFIKSLTGFNPGQAAQLSDLVMRAGGDALLTDEIKTQLRVIATSAALKQGGFDVAPEQILARSGVVPNSNLELLFNNVTLREFTFSYRMSPRSEPEAVMVRKIIHFFKRGMAAKKTASVAATENAGTFLAAPNIFELSYQTGDNAQIAGMNKFKLCALTNFAVNYSPDGQFSAYEKGQPVSYNIGMSFSEIEPIYESDYDEYDISNVGL